VTATKGAEALEFSVVIPAYNESHNVVVVVDEAVQRLDASPYAGTWEIILVDDGSTDDTAEIVDRLAAADRRVRAIHHPSNRGFGAALKTGYASARGRLVTLISGDGEISVDQPLELAKAMGSADLVISTRVRDVHTSRSVLTAAFAFLTKAITGFDAADMSGVYVINRGVLQTLLLKSNTGVVNFEVVMRCAARGCEIRSGVTRARPRLSGESKVTNARTIVRVLGELLALRLG
jgi:glycosyltransferase involved in cell wall biosynthesis